MNGISGSSSDPGQRSARIMAVVADIGRRRLAGETITDDHVVAQHPDLQPELSQRLAILQQVERARNAAERSSHVSLAEFDDDRDTLLPENFTPPGYRLQRVIHAGGQGIVYQALQETTHRTVALKTLRSGTLASEAEQLRLEREVQLLASLRHPNIVTIHDSGSHEGQSYFAMDYIDGRPLDGFVADARIGVRQRIELFETIATAVHAAHLKGILHRDLKPGNILVDQSGVPHILDFGLAKELDQSHGMTETGQFVGSVPWASPEQARGPASAIDIRSDVYALGVLLYQALTGEFPYDVTSGLQSALHNIIAVDPVAPRERNAALDEDLETIVLTCLHKDPERRYQSAGELALELRRYLGGEPIAARRDSTLYVLRKQLARYRRQVLVAGAFALLLGIGTIVSFKLYQQADTLRGEAVASAAAESRAADRAQAANRFLKNMFLRLDPAQVRGRNASLLAVLNQASSDLQQDALQDPALQVDLLTTLGRAYFALGRYPLARTHLEQALELASTLDDYPTHELTEIVAQLANVLLEQGDVIGGEKLARTALALDLRQFGPEHPNVAISRHNLANLLLASGKADEARPLYRSALDTLQQGERGSEFARCANALAVLLLDAGDKQEAEQLFRTALETRRTFLPSDHPEIARNELSLAFALLLQNQHDEAARLADTALRTQRKVLPSTHPELGRTLVVRGRIELEAGRTAQAEPLLVEGLDIRRTGLPADHWLLPATESVLGACRTALGRYPDAERLLQTAYDKLNPDPRAPRVRVRETIERLITLYELWNRPADALRWKDELERMDERNE